MKRRDAPKIVNAGIWTAVIVCTLVFSVSIVSYFFSFSKSNISADTSGICGEGKTRVAINNYPGENNLLNETHSSYYLNSSDNYFRCSYICIDSYDPNATVAARIQSAIGGGTIGGSPIQFYNTIDEFNSAVKEGGTSKTTAMTRGIIVPQTKTSCTGMPNSISYAPIKTADGTETVTQIPRGDEQQQPEIDEQGIAKPTVEEISAKTVAGAPVPLTVGTTGDGGSAKTDENINELDECKSYINNFLIAYSRRIKNNEDLSKFYRGMEDFYIDLKKNIKSGKWNNDSALDYCQTYKNTIINYLKKRAESVVSPEITSPEINGKILTLIISTTYNKGTPSKIINKPVKSNMSYIVYLVKRGSNPIYKGIRSAEASHTAIPLSLTQQEVAGGYGIFIIAYTDGGNWGYPRSGIAYIGNENLTQMLTNNNPTRSANQLKYYGIVSYPNISTNDIVLKIYLGARGWTDNGGLLRFEAASIFGITKALLTDIDEIKRDAITSVFGD